MNPKKTAFLLLLGLLLLTAIAVYQSRHLRFDYHFESFFPAGDPELDRFNFFKEKFGNDNDYILLGIANQEGIFEKDFLKDVERLGDSLATSPLIRQVITPSVPSFMIFGPFGPTQVPYLHPDKPELFAADSARIYEAEGLKGTMFSEDGKAVNVILTTIPEPSKVKSDSIVYHIRNTVKHFDFDQLHVTGKVPAQYSYINRMKDELILFISIAVALLSVLLAIMFRSLWGVLAPLIIVFLSIIWLLGLMGTTGKNIDLIMTLMPTMMFVVGISDAMHLLTRYAELVREGLAKFQALKRAVKEIGVATILTSLTTAAGFLTLVTTSIKPVREFGIYIAAGVLFALVITYLLLPAILIIVPPPGLKKAGIKYSKHWNRIMRSLLRLSFTYRWSGITATIIIIPVALAGISRIEVNTFLLEDLKPNDPLQQSFTFIEERFGGVRPLEVLVETGTEKADIWDYEIIRQIAFTENLMQSIYQSASVMSPAKIVMMFNQAINGGNPEYFKIPPAGPQYDKVVTLIKKYRKLPQVKQVATTDGNYARLSARMPDLGSREVSMRDDTFYRQVRAHTDTASVKFSVTGTARLIDKNIAYMSTNMMEGLGIAFLIIAIITGVMYRSFIIVLIGLIPNILPLMLVAGIMGFMGVDLKVSTSIIFTIAFGIAVDDTIHFLSRFRLEIRSGRNIPWAIRRSYNITGRAIILTSMVLVTGFITLSFSAFAGTMLVGVLISLTLFFAVVFDLFLLPVLLLAYGRVRKNRSGR